MSNYLHDIARVQVEAKTRKLKKVWNKLQVAQAEIKDLTEEFQKEREDMLDTIRELNKQLKLKQMLLDSFVPPHEVERVRGLLLVSEPCCAAALVRGRCDVDLPAVQIEARATWDEEADEWSLDGLELAGNRLRVRRPPSSTSPALRSLLLLSPMPDARPTSRYAAARHQYEPDNPRFLVCSHACGVFVWVLCGCTNLDVWVSRAGRQPGCTRIGDALSHDV